VRYKAFRDFIEDGIVRCLVRDKVSVDGANLARDPTISDLYLGWRRRDSENTANFFTQELGSKRECYNQHIDRLLFEEYPGAVVRYDPDIARPRFREIVRADLSQKRFLWELVCKLPPNLQYQYEQTCAEKQFMTTVDLWTLVKDHVHLNQAAKSLMLMQGYVNQQAIADSITAGVAGSDWGHPWRPSFLDRQRSFGARLADVLDQADLTLTAPAIELLALFSPSDIKELRRVATDGLFNLSVPEGADSDAVRRVTVEAMKVYWAQVCEVLDRKFPQHTRAKTQVLGFFDERVATFKHFIRRFPWLQEAVSLLVDVPIAVYAPPGTSGAGKKLLKRVGYRLFYKPTHAFEDLKEITNALWKPRATWTTLHNE
jgi:hypothetical protein